jgi:hypothetical protein
VADEELQRALLALQQGENAEQALKAMAHRLTNKLIHAPTQALRQAAAQGTPTSWPNCVRCWDCHKNHSVGAAPAVPSSIENPRVMNPSLIRKLEGLIERHEEVQALLGEPGVASDQDRYRALTREYAQLEDIVHAFQRFRQAEENLETTRLMLEEEDADLREMAQEELPLAKATFEEQEQALQVMLLPRDPKDDNNCYLEIRAGAGGDEAAIFAGDLFRMYPATPSARAGVSPSSAATTASTAATRR